MIFVQHLIHISANKGLEFQLVCICGKEWPRKMDGPLICAVRQNRQDLVQMMIQEANVDVDSFYDLGEYPDDDWCALGCAIRSENDDMAKFLVFQMKANVNAVDLINKPRTIGIQGTKLFEFLVLAFKNKSNLIAKIKTM
jgi:hypothetical protein